MTPSADSYTGPGRSATALVDAVDDEPLNFASNVVADPDDVTIYFTASSRRWPPEQWMGALVEHSGTGRLFRLSPEGEVETLLDGLQFANGVAFTTCSRTAPATPWSPVSSNTTAP